MSNESEREYGWDDEIQNDGPEYVVLPDGDYNFKVTGFERGRYEGGEKIPACNMAIITLEIENDKGICFIQNRLFLHSRCEGLLQLSQINGKGLLRMKPPPRSVHLK